MQDFFYIRYLNGNIIISKLIEGQVAIIKIVVDSHPLDKVYTVASKLAYNHPICFTVERIVRPQIETNTVCGFPVEKRRTIVQ